MRLVPGFLIVGRGRLELPRLAAHGPKPCAYTIPPPARLQSVCDIVFLIFMIVSCEDTFTGQIERFFNIYSELVCQSAKGKK